jgi:hypothetical protein
MGGKIKGANLCGNCGKWAGEDKGGIIPITCHRRQNSNMKYRREQVHIVNVGGLLVICWRQLL